MIINKESFRFQNNHEIQVNDTKIDTAFLIAPPPHSHTQNDINLVYFTHSIFFMLIGQKVAIHYLLTKRGLYNDRGPKNCS